MYNQVYQYNMNILSKTDIKKISRQLDKQFGIEKLDQSYAYLKTSKNKIFVINRDIERINPNDFNINTAGLYIAKEEIDGVRLSIEGSQFLGPKAVKNVLILEDPGSWLKGQNIEIKTDLKGYVIVKYKNDFLGCGRVTKTKLQNFIPKARRISELAPSA